jgi:hypothetical protein
MGVTKYGEGNKHTIKVGRIYAINLQKANRGDDARELLIHHNVTIPRRLNRDKIV